MATLPPLGRGVQRTDSGAGDPIPVFRAQSMRMPEKFQLEPGAAGAFESTINKHRISPMAAQELFDLHADHIRNMSASAQRDAVAYWHAEHVRYRAQPGSTQKIAAAKGLLARYERAHGKAAHDAARAALDRDAGNFPAVIDLLSWADDPSGKRGGGATKSERRYGRAAVARIAEIISTWLGGLRPAYAFQGSAHANE